LHDTVFDTESGESGGQAAESLNLPYLDVIRIVSHDVYSTWIAKSEIHESVAVLVRPDGYVAWRHQNALYDDTVALQKLNHVLQKMQYKIA